MKKLFIILFAAGLASCDSTQKGQIDYNDSTNSQADTTTIHYTPAEGDSIRTDSTMRDTSQQR